MNMSITFFILKGNKRLQIYEKKEIPTGFFPKKS